MDPDRIRARIAERGVQQRDVAAAAKLTEQALSKVLSGRRKLQLHEAQAVARFLDMPLDAGFSEPDAAPYDPGPDDAALIEALARSARTPATYTVESRDLFPFGLLRGDLALIDLGARPRDGDLVIAGVADLDADDAQTVIRRIAGGFLLSPNPNDRPLAADGNAVSVYGPIVAVARRGR